MCDSENESKNFKSSFQAPKPSPTVVPLTSTGQSSSVHRVILPATTSSSLTQGSVVTTLAPIQV